MSPNLTTRPTADVSPETTASFNVVVAYDELGMGVRAKHVLDAVTPTLRPDCHPVVNIWKFSMLQVSDLVDSAVREAVAANMIILALCEDNGLPPATKAWIESWLLRRASAVGALILLFHPAVNPATVVSSTHCYLLDVGQRGNFDVFALRDESDWEDLRWVCVECNRIHASSPPTNPLPGHPSNRFGQPFQNRPA